MILSPARPCVGEPAKLQLKNINAPGGERTATVWLRGNSASQAWSDPATPPYAVKLGQATLDAAGDGQLTFTLQPEMGPLTTGGNLTIEPDRHYELMVQVGNGSRQYGLLITPPGLYAGATTTPCAAVSLAPATPRLISIEPESACPGENITIKGSGFSGDTVIVTTSLVLYMGNLRRTPSNSVVGEVAIDSNGQFSLVLATTGNASAVAAPYAAGTHFEVEVYDQYGTRLTRAERTLKIMDCRR